MFFQSTFNLDWYGRVLTVHMTAGKRTLPEYPVVPKDSDVWLQLREFHERFPQNPLYLMLTKLKNLKMRINGMTNSRAPRSEKRIKNRESRLEEYSAMFALFSDVLKPVLGKGGRFNFYISIQQFRDILYAALENYSSMELAKVVYLRRIDSPSDKDAVYVDTKEWFEAWLHLLTSDLPETTDTDALSFYADWSRQLIFRDRQGVGCSSDIPMLPEKIEVYDGKVDPVNVQVAPTQSVGQQMSILPEDTIVDPKTSITLKTEVVINRVASQELSDIIERIQLMDDSGTRFYVGDGGTLTVEISVPTYCGFPISDGDHKVALQTAAQHIDNILRLVEVARSMQESQRRVEHLAEAYSGR